MVCQAGSARLHWRDVRLRHANRWPDARLQMSHLILGALRPALAAFSCRAQSLLVLGKPGTGKTTLLRDIARIMSTPPQQGGLGLAVLIVDTSNEIAGEGSMVSHTQHSRDKLNACWGCVWGWQWS
jgi:stage III sporulation protein SpoIIIAA